MKPENENLTAQQSLDIITSMIMQAKGNIRKNNILFLLWGWVIFAANIGMYSLIKLGYERPYIVWAITIPAWIFSLYKGFTQERRQGLSTHLDKISGSLWIAFGIVVFTFVVFGRQINFQLNPLILTMCAIPTAVSGIILKFRPLVLGGIAFWIFGIVSFSVSRELQPLIGATAIVFGYLVPGYMLKKREN